MKNRANFSLRLLVATSVLAALPGCKLSDSLKNMFGCGSCCSSSHGGAESTKSSLMPAEAMLEEVDKGPVMVSIDGEPAMYKADFDEALASIAASPQFRGLSVDALPSQMKTKILENLAKLKAFEKFAKSKGIEQEAEFKNQMRKVVDSIRQQLLVQFLQKQLFDAQTATPDEVRAEYEKNHARYVSQPGGVLVSAVKFSDEAKAKAFMDSVAGHLEQFDDLGRKAEEGTFRHFGRLQEDAPMVPQAFKDEVLNMSSFPQLKMVKDGDDYWVVYAANKTEPAYMAFEEVREHLENMIKSTKFQAELEKLEKDLEKKYDIKINQELLQQEDAAKNAAMQEQALGGKQPHAVVAA